MCQGLSVGREVFDWPRHVARGDTPTVRLSRNKKSSPFQIAEGELFF